MKLFAEDGDLRPKTQVALGLIVAALFLRTGIMGVMFPSLSTDRFFGILELIAVPACMYVAWYGYRKMKKVGQTAATALIVASVSLIVLIISRP